MGRIVLIDDCRITLAAVKEILEEAGHEVSTAVSGSAVRDCLAASRRPNLLLIDVEMPQMRGDDAVRDLRARPEGQDIPVLYMSGLSADELRLLVDDTGADGFVTKPLDPRSLLDSVERLLQ